MSTIADKETYKPGDFWHNPKDTITADDTRTNGAGIVNTIDVLQGAVKANDKVTEGIAGAGLALDVLGLLIDPLGVVFAAGIGWLIEHVTPFRVPLDLLMGDPEGITVATEAIGSEKDKVDEWAQDFKNDLDALMDSWSGEAADKFKENTDSLAEGLTALGESLESAKKTMAICGAVIGAVRGIIRDFISSLLSGILTGAIAAVAAMPFTFGASVGIFLGVVVGTVAVALGQIATQIAKLTKALSDAAKAIKDLGKGTRGLGDDASRAADDAPSPGSTNGTDSSTHAGDDTPTPPPANTGGGTGPGTAVTHDGPPATGGATPSTRPPGDGTTPNFSRPLPQPGTAITHDTPPTTGGATPSTRPPGDGTTPNFSRPFGNEHSGDSNGSSTNERSGDSSSEHSSDSEDASWWRDTNTDKTRDLFMDGATKYAREHPEKNISPTDLEDFGSKMDKIIGVMDGGPPALRKMGVPPEIVEKVEDYIKTVTDSTHGGYSFITKSTIDFIRFGAFPAMEAAGVFPDESRGDNA
ncbi:WXG100 family type VII secretion target [Amycolatopsis sp. NPDC049253]|uniref:WXG100 family type VII secretion target n=1 Tax=Amycolatopsis sp. NPDC049253 TaxID=3155274 RepID=UPI003419C924